MTLAANEFDLLGVKLAGSHLLEAGAGTGKTYSLSFLYLRLLLEKALTVEQIVVTTFTKAATAELKTRIYSRLMTRYFVSCWIAYAYALMTTR